MASSYDIGTGRITGYFTGGRADVLPVLDRALAPVAALGPFTQVNVPIVGHRQLRLHDAGRAQPGGEPGVGELRAQLPRAVATSSAGPTCGSCGSTRPSPRPSPGASRRSIFSLPRQTAGQVDSLVRNTDLARPDEVVQRVRRVGGGETRAAALALRMARCPAPVAQSPPHCPFPALPGGAPGPLPPPPRARAAPRLRARAHS